MAPQKAKRSRWDIEQKTKAQRHEPTPPPEEEEEEDTPPPTQELPELPLPKRTSHAQYWAPDYSVPPPPLSPVNTQDVDNTNLVVLNEHEPDTQPLPPAYYTPLQQIRPKNKKIPLPFALVTRSYIVIPLCDSCQQKNLNRWCMSFPDGTCYVSFSMCSTCSQTAAELDKIMR